MLSILATFALSTRGGSSAGDDLEDDPDDGASLEPSSITSSCISVLFPGRLLTCSGPWYLGFGGECRVDLH